MIYPTMSDAVYTRRDGLAALATAAIAGCRAHPVMFDEFWTSGGASNREEPNRTDRTGGTPVGGRI
jgi:hypothetical protein